MGYTTSTIHGIEVPNSAEANDVPEDIGKVVTALEGGSIIRRLTGSAIGALSAAQKPAGLVVYNTTTNKLQISNGTTFSDLADATKLPLAGGTMTGDLEIERDGAALVLDSSSATPIIKFQKSGVTRGTIALNIGGDALTLTRYSTGGVAQDTPLKFVLSTGQVVSNSHIGGAHTATTGSNGEITLTLPTSPTGNWAVTVTGTSIDGSGSTGYGQLFYVTAVTSTSATVRVARSSTGAYINSTSVTFRYTAVAY